MRYEVKLDKIACTLAFHWKFNLNHLEFRFLCDILAKYLLDSSMTNIVFIIITNCLE